MDDWAGIFEYLEYRDVTVLSISVYWGHIRGF